MLQLIHLLAQDANEGDPVSFSNFNYTWMNRERQAPPIMHHKIEMEGVDTYGWKMKDWVESGLDYAMTHPHPFDEVEVGIAAVRRRHMCTTTLGSLARMFFEHPFQRLTCALPNSDNPPTLMEQAIAFADMYFPSQTMTSQQKQELNVRLTGLKVTLMAAVEAAPHFLIKKSLTMMVVSMMLNQREFKRFLNEMEPKGKPKLFYAESLLDDYEQWFETILQSRVGLFPLLAEERDRKDALDHLARGLYSASR